MNTSSYGFFINEIPKRALSVHK